MSFRLQIESSSLEGADVPRSQRSQLQAIDLYRPESWRNDRWLGNTDGSK